MILRIEDFKDVCSTILSAIDINELAEITETIELKCENSELQLNVTNREYYVRVKIPVNETENFHATVNANLFLRLISQLTSETIEFTLDSNNLIIKANGKYKVPLIFADDSMLTLPQIKINNVTNTFNISRGVLNSIFKYNGKELAKSNFNFTRPVQRLYYMDEQGCITFTSGACVNNFTLSQPVKILFSQRIVKLFKLFDSEEITFSIGYDEISSNLIQTKVSFTTDNVDIVAILSCDDTLLNSVPAAAIRKRANDTYLYSVFVNKNDLNQALNRLMLFDAGFGSKKSLKSYARFKFHDDTVEITDNSKENIETIYTVNDSKVDDYYEMTLDIIDIKNVLDVCNEEFINIRFGNHTAVVISRGNINNVIPECQE